MEEAPVKKVEQKEEKKEENTTYCSCVRTAQEIYPTIPLQDAIDYKSNGTLNNGELVLLQYKSKKSEGYVYHIAPFELGTSSLHIFNEGNFEECQKTKRDIPFNDEHILGYFDVELWQKIQELPLEAQKTIFCESHFQHYNSDGSVMRGKDGEYGIAQIMRKTMNWWNKLRREEGLRYLEILDPYDQIEMVKWAWQHGYQDHWTCYRELFE